MSDQGESGSVEVPRRVLARVEERVASTEFDDANAYVTYVLEEVLHHSGRDEPTADTVDEQQVRDRLESLGYLNE